MKFNFLLILVSANGFMIDDNRVPTGCGQKLFSTNVTTCPKLPPVYLNSTTTARRPLKHARNLTIVREKRTDLCPLLKIFPKYVKVFDLYFVASQKSPDDKLLHGASVMYQYIDSDDDGIPDNSLVYEKLVEIGATMYMFNNSQERDENQDFFDHIRECDDLILQDLQADETRPGRIMDGDYDAALEEVFHLITHGYVEVYPSVFGLEGNSYITCLMDEARGGHFPETPDTYPSNAWYTYDDTSCVYECMMYEYLYWAYTTYLGAHAHRKDEIRDEWLPSTCLELQRYDKSVYALFLNPDYKFAQVLPEPLHNYATVKEDKTGKDSSSRFVKVNFFMLFFCAFFNFCIRL